MTCQGWQFDISGHRRSPQVLYYCCHPSPSDLWYIYPACGHAPQNGTSVWDRMEYGCVDDLNLKKKTVCGTGWNMVVWLI